ncbi:MAG: bifunctional 2-C-methyl-D-erythritol 4-phosphate cytidylyltransferase/2-C-methyl-D-erythritol 2,4-cyclodiphosphate synthase [Sediminimonas qiaohouensis]|uniref:Bifunctional enzyme IspD/IspF n=1 Tax=Sediminimonas qiaohouensis TaxID=552061 RepID=A0A7C9LAF9_9RHOB|nr:bifunctional 2-C-methyl-D-erythritol 4-phosphate cytidylyltransferase/2-C-methyl-D-erythritol 2,4-cyclodiphosphate synthase [Sediminimonas qiaohouensis]MTJ04098.1 bifunctional 2-C-methyl-D-erythritol 4-phosphate cytidylyltransferase/2-C-methyl-D-erythritol 2,4-cyclodiphosphate synthase [Sediminimonas qiaohouensis]
MTTAAIILAAGRGTRAGGEIAKQWQPIAGRRVIDWTLDAFHNAPGIDSIVVVLPPGEVDRIETTGQILTTAGGDSRAASVKAGLEMLTDAQTVLIHDVARPCVSQSVIADVIRALSHSSAAAPALPVSDALWRGDDGAVTGIVPRDGLWRAQTPQGFDVKAIRAAHNAHPDDAADDVQVARAAGLEVAIVPGDEDNIKITTRADFARAERILRGHMSRDQSPDFDVRTGNGYDVHRFAPGDHVILCGVKISHTHTLKGHSDADVGMHAITDALYGALAEGDIGRHFPPSDARWKGAASDIFLAHAVETVRARGYRIANIDCTLICEQPKIGPHAGAMQTELAQITGIDATRISVKATTSEKLGFTGREEGIAATATATVIRP